MPLVFSGQTSALALVRFEDLSEVRFITGLPACSMAAVLGNQNLAH